MNSKQAYYCKMRGLVGILKDNIDQHMKAYPMGDTDLSIDLYYNEQARFEKDIGYWYAVQGLRDAENQVIEWAKAVMIHKYPERYEQVKSAFDKRPGNIIIKEKLVDICMRLSA